MRDDPYRLYAAFSGGEFMPFPISSCPCAVGRFFCSHVLAFLLIMRLVVAHGVDYDELGGLFEKTDEVKRAPVPVAFYYGRDAGSVRAESAALKGEIEGAGGGQGDGVAERLAAEEDDEHGVGAEVVNMSSEVDRMLKEGRARKAKRAAAGNAAATAKKLDIGMIEGYIDGHMAVATGDEFLELQDEVLERIHQLNQRGIIDGTGVLITEYNRIYADERQGRLAARGVDAWGGGPGLKVSDEVRPRTNSTEGEAKKRRFCAVS